MGRYKLLADNLYHSLSVEDELVSMHLPPANFDRELFINSKHIQSSATATFVCECSD